MKTQLQTETQSTTQTPLFNHWLNDLWQRSFDESYDLNGNLISKTDNTNTTTHTWDSLNRLTTIDLPNTPNDVQLGYNGNNERISKTVGGITTNYLVDSNSPLPQIIQETTGSQTTSYVLGLDLIAQDNGTTREYLLADALGSTRNLIDNTGAVVKSVEYDIFGAIRSQSGTANTSFTFTGEQTDDESGLIFLRARYYDPEIGRFISKDPFKGFETDTQSLNPYPYVKNNPTNLVDPEGDIPQLAVLAAPILTDLVIKAAAVAVVAITTAAILTDQYLKKTLPRLRWVPQQIPQILSPEAPSLTNLLPNGPPSKFSKLGKWTIITAGVAKVIHEIRETYERVLEAAESVNRAFEDKIKKDQKLEKK